MCGIAGIIAPNAIQYKEPLQKMTDAIVHRGPDAEGHEFFENAAFGHRRLSIIDLSETGKQPMFSDTRNECIVLNGEIYGYQDLKKKYSDYAYKGSSDTELILAMYRQKGTALLDELPGMFAFAIWDENKQQLFCARDRFGEKPLYYAQGKNGAFIFASEIKAILATGLIEPRLNREALYHFLKYGYVSAHQSIWENIKTLPPAHLLLLKNGNIRVERYWKLPASDREMGLAEAKEEFSSLLRKAVQKQLVADVPVGSFLSGGLDSSSIVALASEILPKQSTISFGYSGAHSELDFASEIAEKYRTNHIEILENRGRIADELTTISKYFDEPFSDMSYTPQYKICEAAARHLKVVLAGDVGDELFGGYNFYRIENELKQHFSYGNAVKKFGLSLYRKFREVSYITNSNLSYSNILDFHQNYVRNYLSDNEIKALGITAKYAQTYSFTPNPHSLNDIMRVDMEKYVPGNMLVKSDRMAMANSLEVRTPFLDKDFAEFCIQLPTHLKIKGEQDKIILRETMSEYWTDSIRLRQKQGFGSDVKNWFEEDDLIKLSDNLLKDKNQKLFTLIDFDAAQQMLTRDKKHWNLLQLALWSKNYASFI